MSFGEILIIIFVAGGVGTLLYGCWYFKIWTKS